MDDSAYFTKEPQSQDGSRFQQLSKHDRGRRAGGKAAPLLLHSRSSGIQGCQCSWPL